MERMTIKKEGLLVSENTIQMVKNIIDGKQNVLPNGINDKKFKK
jgi:hypothetical protein